MLRRITMIAVLGGLLALTGACTNKKVQNPLANVGSKQPDKVLFDRAMDALKHNKFDVARMTLQTLINTYPDSEYIARAKLAVADSWYAEGGTAALTQAEIEYKDFETFFPNLPEAAEAQFKIANIHYQQMEKPDRDYTHALRAEEEYRQMILQYPDSKLVPEAKQRLLEVQEVLAEREFEVGHFYAMREAYPAAIARLKSVAEKYPLYSKADEVLFQLGQAYEGEVTMLRARKLDETRKARMIGEFEKEAAAAYSKIITRYPVMARADDAKARLQALHQPVPKPTKAAVAQNEKEEESRRETGMFGRMMGSFNKHPDVAQATKIGEPTLVDPTPMSATEVVQQATRAMTGAAEPGKASVETIGTGAPPPAGQEAPRSDAPPSTGANTTAPTETGAAATQTSEAGAADSGAGELKPNATPDANELKPNVGSDSQALPPPAQVNELQNAGGSQGAQPTVGPDGKPAAQAASSDDNEQVEVSSKKKKKKGIHKVVPF
jgi:outer membrane protein assembly factor BamD